MEGNPIVSTLLVADTICAKTPFSNALISFQKHEDESEAWLHRQVTIPHANPTLSAYISHQVLSQCLQHGFSR